MNKQWLAEIKKLSDDRKKESRAFQIILRSAVKEKLNIERSVYRAERIRDKNCSRIDRRIAILQGRLS